LKKEILSEKQRADGMTSSFSSLRKVFENTLEIMLRDEDCQDDFEDCLEVFRNVCNLGSEKEVQLLQVYKEKYEKQRSALQKDKEGKEGREEKKEKKKKRSWF
jgi:hypothetical protein